MQQIRILTLATLVSVAVFAFPVHAGPPASAASKSAVPTPLDPVKPARYMACPAGTQRDPACMDDAARGTGSACPCEAIPGPTVAEPKDELAPQSRDD